MAYKAHIHLLDNDSLLQIFSYYRQELEGNWNIRHAWGMIAQVCRRWRHLIYDSSSYLDICLPLTNDSPSKDTPSHLLPVPLVIDNSDRTGTIAQEDDVGRPVLRSASTIPHEVPRAPRAEPRMPHGEPRFLRALAELQVPRAVHHKDPKAFLKYMDHIRNPYRNKAMNLISICRFFIQAQKQTFRSCDELRR